MSRPDNDKRLQSQRAGVRRTVWIAGTISAILFLFIILKGVLLA